MKLLGVLMFFNKDFMTSYVTTIGSSIYFPTEQYIKDNEKNSIAILAHEIVHIAQAEKYGKFLYSLMYLFPQCLALLAIGSVLSIFWMPMLWCLVFLVFLAPIPAPWRAKFEIDGYTMSLFMLNIELRHPGYTIDTVEKKLSITALRLEKLYFKGPNYWFMWPFEIGDVFEKRINDICSGVISDTDEVYGRVSRSYLNAVTAYEL